MIINMFGQNTSSERSIHPQVLNSNLLAAIWFGLTLMYITIDFYINNQIMQMWISKDISRKGEKVLFRMIDEDSNHIAVLDKSGKIEFINDNAQKLIMRN